MKCKLLCIPMVVALATLVSACGVSPDSSSSLTDEQQAVARALSDPYLQSFDFDAPSYHFDGLGGSLVMDDGWAPSDPVAYPYSWIVGTHASLYFGDRGGDQLVLHAQARAYWFEGAPEQLLKVTVNDTPVGSVVIGRTWQDMVFELAPEHLTAGLNRIEFELSYARSPEDVGQNNDSRELSAAFSRLAVDRRPGYGRKLDRRRAFIDGSRQVLVLGDGAEVGLPLPPGMTISWDGLQPGVTVDLEVMDGGWQTVWPPVDGSTGSSLTVDNSAEMTRYLLISRNGGDPTLPVELPWSLSASREVSADDTAYLFVYVVDTLRKDALEVYGAQRDTSPRLSAFARDGLVFENAVAASTWTLPSVASLLTGVYPFQHGVMKGDVKLTSSGGYPLLAELLAGAGYETVGISQSFVAGPQFGIDSGFDDYFVSNQLNSRILRTAEMRRTLTEWLSWKHDWARPLFAYLHTVGPHGPYAPPAEFQRFAEECDGKLSAKEYVARRFIEAGYGDDPQEVAHLRALYDGEVAYADAEFGRFIDLLHYFGIYDNSLIIFTADHGEEFHDHGGFDHGRSVYEEVAEVPLIVKLPTSMVAPGGHRESRRVSLIDVLPTVLEIAGVDAPRGWGRSLLDTVGSSNESPTGEPRPLFTELNPHANDIFESVDYTAAWLEDVKCIHSKTGTDLFGREIEPWRCFDLSSDPQELQPLPDDDPQGVACRKVLEDWMRFSSETSGVTGPAAAEESLELLRAIGYIK